MTNMPKRSFRVRHWGLFTLAWLIVASAVAVFLGSLNWLDYYRLAKSGVAVQGNVTHKDAANHLAVHYSYIVGSRTYDGIGNAPSLASMDTLSIGESLSLYYLAQDPKVSCWGDPNRLLASETLSVLLAVLIIPTALLGFVYYRTVLRWPRVNRQVSSTLIMIACTVFLSCSVDPDRQAAENAVEAFHTRLNAEKYQEIYVEADDQFRHASGESEITEFLAKVHRSLGILRRARETQLKVGYIQGLGAQVILSYDSEFEKGRAVEQFLFQMRDSKALRVRYDIKSPALPE